MSTQLPAPPATPKKMGGWAIASLIVLGLIVFGAISNALEDEPATASTTSAVEDYEAPAEIAPSDVVDVMPQTTVNEFCSVYAQLGDYDLGLEYFTDGYGASQDPSAEEVFDELLTRC